MRSSVINNERGSVISCSDDSTNCYNNNGNDDEDKRREVGGGDSASHILTHSPTPFHFPSLIIIITFNNLHIYNLDIQTLDDDHYNVGLSSVSTYSSLRISL